MNWQPIETAPANVWVLTYWDLSLQPGGGGGFQEVSRREPSASWVIQDGLEKIECAGHKPTHWMPLPEPPKADDPD